MGIYRKGRKYYGVVRLGRTKEQPAVGTFTCYFEGDSDTPASVNREFKQLLVNMLKL